MKNPYFDTRFTYSPKKKEMWRILCSYFQKYIPENSIILDAGAGYCYFINNIKAGEKYALDMDEEVLQYANKDVITKISSCYETQFKDNFFDVIFSSNLLEHLSIEEILLTLKDFYRILKHGGRLIILSPNFKYCMKNYFDDFMHKSVLTDRNMKDMLIGSNFKIEVKKDKFLPFSSDSKIPQNSFLVKIYLLSPLKPFAGQMLFVAVKS